MTQPNYGYTPQYSFWPYYQATPQQLLAPARIAGWLLMALGVLLVLGTSCFGAVLYSLAESDLQNLIAEATKQQPELKQFNPTPRMIRIGYGSLMFVVGLYGLVCIPMGLLVRRGTLVPIVFGLIVSLLPLLLLGGMLLVSLTSGIEGVLGFLCVGGIPTALLTLSAIFLIRAAGNLSRIAQAQQQTQAMYQQQMAQYYGQQQPPAQQ